MIVFHRLDKKVSNPEMAMFVSNLYNISIQPDNVQCTPYLSFNFSRADVQ